MFQKIEWSSDNLCQDHLKYRSDSLTKILDNSTLILNFKIFCEANKQEIEIVTV